MAINTRFATAIQALVLLAIEPDKVHTSDDVARALKTNPVVVRRLFSQLREGGLILSQKGPSGGSKLSQPAKEISLRDIFRAVNPGELPHAPAVTGVPGLQSVLKGVFSDANRAFEKELNETTLSQLVKKSAKKSKHSASGAASERRS